MERPVQFPYLLDVVDTYKIDLNMIRKRIREYLREKNEPRFEFITDLILDYLKSERFPDAKVMQCDLQDIGLISQDKAKKLIARLWDEMVEFDMTHREKYQRTSTSNEPLRRVGTSSSSFSCQRSFDSDYQSNYGRCIDEPNRL